MTDNIQDLVGRAQPNENHSQQQPVDGGADVILQRVQEVVKQVLPDAITNALSEYDKRQQSARDKMMHRINQRFEELSSAFRDIGQEMTPDVEKKLRQKAEEQVRREEQTQSSVPASGQTEKPVGQSQDVMQDAVAKILTHFGVTIDDTDPEAAIIAQSKTPSELLVNVIKAAQSKSERTSASKPTGGLPITVGTQPAADPLAGVKHPDQIWELAKQKIKSGGR
jgi:hypothetical protein